MRRRHVGVVFVAVFLLTVIVYAMIGREDSEVPTTVVDMSWIDSTPQLLRADASGAVIVVERHLRGVARDGATAWQQPQGQDLGMETVCAPKCPAAVTSGDFDDFSADPLPTTFGAAQLPAGWQEATNGANITLSVAPQGSLRLVSNGAGSPELEALHGAKVVRYAFPAETAGWAMLTPDGRAGAITALNATDASNELPVLLAHVGKDGWRIVGPPATRACISAEGDRWVADDVLMWRGKRSPLPESVKGQTCQFTPTHVVFGGRGAQQASNLTALGADAALAWSVQLASYAWAAASQREDRVAVIDAGPNGGAVRVLDATGAVLPSVPGAVTALFDGAGDLVTADASGSVTWQRP